ncbi:MAG TPA: isoprenylcysteine carboxylmethyltransferase family protein [Methylocella sp.]|nr:isoprenylcysteine carboxylmethyltransferase family protein [Methylocella sp.]
MAAIAGEALDFLSPAPLMSFGTFMPWIGGTVFAAGFALAIWSRAALRKIGTPMVPGKPTSAIATDGAYGFSRNPIYVAMLLGQIGLAIGLNNAWLLAATAPLYLVLRYGIVAREETYLERKFGSHYIAYKARVPRWF